MRYMLSESPLSLHRWNLMPPHTYKRHDHRQKWSGPGYWEAYTKHKRSLLWLQLKIKQKNSDCSVMHLFVCLYHLSRSSADRPGGVLVKHREFLLVTYLLSRDPAHCHHISGCRSIVQGIVCFCWRPSAKQRIASLSLKSLKISDTLNFSWKRSGLSYARFLQGREFCDLATYWIRPVGMLSFRKKDTGICSSEKMNWHLG